MSAPSITLYLDVLSPFAYEVYYVFRHNAAFQNVKKTYVPISLRGLMMMTGNNTPMRVKNKDRWVMRDRMNWATAFQIPMKETHPTPFPPNTTEINQILATIQDQEVLMKVLDRLWNEYWVHHTEIYLPASFKPILKEILGEEATEKAQTEALTLGVEVLAKNTDKAFETGGFGVPWMECTNAQGETEYFWGFDHLGQVLRFLDLPRLECDSWRSLL